MSVDLNLLCMGPLNKFAMLSVSLAEANNISSSLNHFDRPSFWRVALVITERSMLQYLSDFIVAMGSPKFTGIICRIPFKHRLSRF